ncbi:hypothetical protein BT96DRAFT_999671 [Gymnopus androsaceus JB14]|uniref:Uncharacterized protein n=1 Tax=Gymnopus androsaceus JB14 TaxID=1447944 RepID=A0A6A4H531_9AGAR|nr:hypothetical protein BT96DRAFT_999671 [Gymnopus androsaceus JB14]
MDNPQGYFNGGTQSDHRSSTDLPYRKQSEPHGINLGSITHLGGHGRSFSEEYMGPPPLSSVSSTRIRNIQLEPSPVMQIPARTEVSQFRSQGQKSDWQKVLGPNRQRKLNCGVGPLSCGHYRVVFNFLGLLEEATSRLRRRPVPSASQEQWVADLFCHILIGCIVIILRDGRFVVGGALDGIISSGILGSHSAPADAKPLKCFCSQTLAIFVLAYVRSRDGDFHPIFVYGLLSNHDYT